MNGLKISAILLTWITQVGWAQNSSTWEVIQTNILNENCIGCHQEGTSFARQSGLVLTQDVSYENLVDVQPKNSAAAADGLLRVSSEGRQAAPHRSFLWEKINATNQIHFYNDHSNYGSLMPLGLASLTNGEIAFIQQWIENGASKNEIIADINLLNDTTRYKPPDFQPLDAPTSGFQLHLGPFDVWPAPKWDREFMYFEPYQTQEDLFITRYEISYREGSHHFILFNYPTGKATPPARTFRDIRTQNGTPNIPHLIQLGNLFPFFFFIGSQTPYANYYFPQDVALRLPSGSGFDLNSHSVNRTGETREGEVYVNLHTIERNEVKHIADYDNFGNFDINLPPRQITTLSKTFFFDETRHIIQMWAHAHEHSTEFRIEGVGGPHNGELLYWSNDWEHPPFLHLDPPLTMQAGEGFKLVTTYNNWTDQTITYGPLSSDEMQFVFYIYYTGNISGVDRLSQLPEEYALHQNFPNPFNPETSISYNLPEHSDVKLHLFNLLGQEIITLFEGQQNAGRKTVRWNGLDRTGRMVSSGVYFYKLETAGFTSVRKLMLLR